MSLFSQQELKQLYTEMIVSDESWIDILGDALELKGVHPGCIFEFQSAIHDDADPGGVVVFGKNESHKLNYIDDYIDVKAMFIRLKHGLHLLELHVHTPSVIARLRELRSELS